MWTSRFSVGRWVLVAVAVIGVAASGSPARATTLRWKLKPGQTLRYALDQKTVTTDKLSGQEVKTTVIQQTTLTWTIKDVDARGTADATLTFDRMHTKVESPFATFEYDSASDKAPEGAVAQSLVRPIKTLVGARFSFRISPLGEVSDVKVPESVSKMLRELGANQGGANSGPFSEDGLKKMISDSSLVLPSEDLAQGKTWTRQTKSPSPGIGTMIVDTTYRYQGPDEQAAGAEKIGVEAKLQVEPMPGANITLKVKSHDGRGSFSFDNNAGHVIGSTVTEKTEIVISAMNVEITRSTDSTSTTKLAR